MENIKFIQDQEGNDFVIIDRGNGEYTSMTKAHYDELEAAKAEVKADEAKTK